MDLVAILLLVLINAHCTISRNLISRRTDLTKQINSENDQARSNPATEIDYNEANAETGINVDSANLKQDDSVINENIDHAKRINSENKQAEIDPATPIDNNEATTDAAVNAYYTHIRQNDTEYEVHGPLPSDNNAKQINSEKYRDVINPATPIYNNAATTDTTINTDSTNKQNDTKIDMNVDSQYEIHGPLARDSYDADVIEENNNIARSKDLRQFDYSHDQLTVRNIIETQTLSSFRTTSLDFLREMLGRNLDHPNPAPQHIGQLNKDLMLPVTQKLFRLEDYYDPLSADKTIREDFTSCESQRVQCISNTDYNLAVCVIDMTIPESVEATLRVKGFHSMCEVTYRNCLKRYELTGKNYADHYSEDYLEFFHYGWCQQCFNLIDNCPG